MNQRPSRILIVRLSAIGDVVQAMPLASALRKRFPDAHIAWAVGKGAAPLLAGHRAVDELIHVSRRWLKSPREIWQLRRRLRAMEFDVVIEAQGLSKSALLARLSGTRRRIGFGNPWGRELSRWLNTECVDTTSFKHVVDRNLALLQPLGIESPAIQFDVPDFPDAEEATQAMLRSCGVAPGAFALLNVGAGWPSRLWPAERFAAVAAELGRRDNLPCLVLWAGNEERRLAEQVIAGSAGNAQLAPPTTLTEMATLARYATLFVSSDTGPLHLAAAIGTPCVGLYGVSPAERHAPRSPQHVILERKVYDGPPHQRRHASAEYMEAIGTELVYAACRQILDRRDRPTATRTDG